MTPLPRGEMTYAQATAHIYAKLRDSWRALYDTRVTLGRTPESILEASERVVLYKKLVRHWESQTGDKSTCRLVV